MERGRFIDYVTSLPTIQPIWEAHTRHEFVLGLGAGTLPLKRFKYYLVQDYLFLSHYARAICVSASKAPTLSDVFAQAETALSVREEMKMHVSYCSERFDLSEDEMAATAEHPACSGYAEYVKKIGEGDDWLSMQVALAPCMYGYKVVGEFLSGWEGTVKGKDNRYWSWIEQYAGDEYVEAVRKGTQLLEKYAAQQTPQKINELVRIFQKAAELEIGFWDMGMKGASWI